MFDPIESTKNMLVYLLEEGEVPDRFSLGMLQNKKLNYFLPLSTLDGNKLRIPLTEVIPLVDYLEQLQLPEHEDRELARFLGCVTDSLRGARGELKNHMLPMEGWLLDVHFVFVDRQTKELKYICLPSAWASCLQSTPREFLRTVAGYAIGPSPKRSAPALALLTQCNNANLLEEDLLLQGSYQFEDWEEVGMVAEKGKGKAKEKAKEKPKEKPPWKERWSKLINGTPRGEEKNPPLIKVSREEKNEVPCIVLRGSGKRVMVEGTMVFGTASGKVDVLLEDNPFADPEHARILLRQGKYYLEDLNSDMGTWLNSAKLKPGEPVLLSSADVIKMGREELIFTQNFEKTESSANYKNRIN